MSNETVRITWPSGIEIYGQVAEDQSGAGYSKPRLLNISNVYRAVNKEKAFENSSVEVELDNTDGYFSVKMVGSDQFIKGKLLEYYDGSDLIFSGKISKLPRCPVNRFRVVADIAAAGLNAKLNSVIKVSDFANVPAENAGKWGNIIAGTADDTGGAGVGMCTAYRVDTGTYLAAWHHLHSLVSVFNSAGTNITASCTLDNNADGNAYILYTSSDLEIYFNAEGFECSSAFSENPATILAEMNTLFGDFTIDGISAAATIYTGRAYTGISIVIGENSRPDITWGELLQKFAKDWDAMIFMQANGHLKIKVLEWGGETAVANIPEIFISDYQNWKDIEKIINEYKRMYWYHWRKNYFHRLPSDVEDITSWEAESEELDLRLHSNDATSKDVAAGILFFMKNPAIYYRINVEGGKANALDLGDVVNVRFDKGYYPNDYRMMQIYRKEKGSNGSYYLEGIDITEINYGLIQLWNDEDAEVYLLLNESSDPDCGVLL